MHPVRPVIIPPTYEDYAALPSDGRRWELIDGELEPNPAPSPRHQTVSRRLQFELMRALEERELALIFNAPVHVMLSDHDIVQPDLAIVQAARSHLVASAASKVRRTSWSRFLSPGTRVLDRWVKKATYARFAVPEYWLIDPQGCHIERYRLSPEQYVLEARFDRASRLTTPSFAEVDIDLARVFRP